MIILDEQGHIAGITLTGPSPSPLLEDVPMSDLLDEVRGNMSRCVQIFEDQIDRSLNFCNSHIGQSFFSLTCCGLLHPLQPGKVQSKKAGLGEVRPPSFASPPGSGISLRKFQRQARDEGMNL